MDDSLDEFGNVVSPAAQLGAGAAPLGSPVASASSPAVAALANPRNEPPPARVRAPSKCSLCLAVGITCTTHTKAKCHRNPAAVNVVVLDGGALPLALDHRPLEGHFVHGAAQHAAPILPLNPAIAPQLSLDAAGYSSGGSSDIEAPAAGSGDDSDSSQEADLYLPFAQAAWTPYVMQEQVALPNPWYPALRSRDAVDGVVEGPEPPPVVPMFGGEVPPFTKANEKGASRNIPRSCKTAWDFIDLLFEEADWERVHEFGCHDHGPP